MKSMLELHQSTNTLLYQPEFKKSYGFLHILIPVYNEEKAILNIIERIHESLAGEVQYKITVIDDGSTDNTCSMLRNSSLDFELQKNRGNLGKGYTLRKGIHLIHDDEIVVLIDGDGEHLPEDIPNLIRPIFEGKADIVIGSRFLTDDHMTLFSGSYLRNHKRFSKFRKIGNLLISFLIFLIYHHFISDSQSGFRVFAPGVLPELPIIYNRFEIETEMLLRAIKLNLRIKEVSINSGLSSRESHMRILRDSLKIISLIILMKFQSSFIE